MDLRVISKDIIKPSAQVFHHLQPFKLSFFDQLMPPMYIPLIFFYPTTNSESAQISTQLKTSLSQTLSIFYPFSGRVKDNSFIDNYEEGVPYIETRVGGCLMDFLKQPKLELLNQFLPCQPFSNLSDQEYSEIAQVIIQVNIFDCGGVAMGVCLLHKIIDAATASTFLHSLAADARGSCNEKINPDDHIVEGSLRFPPQNQLSVKPHSLLVEKNLFSEGKYITRRFVFDAKAIATLRVEAKSEGVDTPTRIETLSSFIWKSCMEASMFLSASPRLVLSIQAVNIRQKIEPCLSKYSIGNLFTNGVTTYNLPDENIKSSDLVALTKRAIKSIKVDYLNALQGDEGFQVICHSLKQLEEVSSNNSEKLLFSSWLNFGFNDLDFGWGKPIWVGVFGQASLEFLNNIIFKESGWNNEDIEAWMTLDESIMSTVERDPKFLKFASPNPSILMPKLA